MPITENIWTQGAGAFMSVEHTSQKRVLHPAIASIVERAGGIRLLDYGCGDGRLIPLLPEGLDIDVYDKSPAMLELAQERAGARISRVLRSPDQIATAVYDVVVLSMVLITIDNEAEYGGVLADCRRVLAPGGTLVVAVSHPCFRPYLFSNFNTSFTIDQPFLYLHEGSPFTVAIRDEQPPSVSFVDYHWSFSYTLNALTQAGLRLTGAIETPDDPKHPFCNHLVSPFLILTCTCDET